MGYTRKQNIEVGEEITVMGLELERSNGQITDIRGLTINRLGKRYTVEATIHDYDGTMTTVRRVGVALFENLIKAKDFIRNLDSLSRINILKNVLPSKIRIKIF